MTEAAPARRRTRRTLLIILAEFILVGLIMWFTLTSTEPLLPEPLAPTAEQVGGGRDAYRQLRDAKGNASGSYVSLGAEELDGLSALASHGFRPDRLRLSIQGQQFRTQASHRLPLSRWLNVTIAAEAPSTKFPRTQLTIGALSLPPLLSRWALELGRRVIDMRHGGVPPLDRTVRNFAIKDGKVTALVSLPSKTGLVDQMAGVVTQQSIDGTQVARIYCELAQRQKAEPSKVFADQVHRAFSLDRAGAAQIDFNRSAFVALGMLLVDERVGDFAGTARDEIRRCRIPTVYTSIHDRFDWTAHWVLSAAIAVGAGVQLSEAVGEWKELSDSLSRQSRFSVGDPSGFSMADLAADRAGFLTARAAVDPASADRIAQLLTQATPEQLLPSQLVRREDGLTNAEFVKRYGGVDDPRFKARVSEIDHALAKTGLR